VQELADRHEQKSSQKEWQAAYLISPFRANTAALREASIGIGDKDIYGLALSWKRDVVNYASTLLNKLHGNP